MNARLAHQAESNTRLHGRWLLAARSAWFIIVAWLVVLFVIAIPYQVEQVRILCSGSSCLSNAYQLSQSDLQQLQQAGLSLDFYVSFTLSIQIIHALIFLVVAAIIFWQRSDDWMGIFVSLVLVLFGIAGSGMFDSLSSYNPALQFPVQVVKFLGNTSIALLCLLFPNGRFVPRWTRWLVPLLVLRDALDFILPNSVLIGDLFFLEIAIPLFAQLYRYWRVSNTEQRLQTKWVIFGIMVVALSRFGILIPVVVISPSIRPSGLSFLIVISALNLSTLAIPLSIGMAILRSHLWDIDILIRRTLIYAMITASLALCYFGSVLALQQVFRSVTGDTSPIAIVLSTLVIAALFTPLRRGLQNFIDRRFYRRKYDADQALETFRVAARNEVELGKLTSELLAVASHAIQPLSISLWLKPTKASKPNGNDTR